MSQPESRGRGQWVGLALGLPIMAAGVRGILENSDRTRPADLARWLVGSAVVHDALVVPVVVTVAFLARRITPPIAWPPVRWALATTGVLLVVSWPFVRGYGRRASNPSLLPRNYAMGTAVAVLVVWGLAGAWTAWRAQRRSSA